MTRSPRSAKLDDPIVVLAESDANEPLPIARQAGGLTHDWGGSEYRADRRFEIAFAPSSRPSPLEPLSADR